MLSVLHVLFNKFLPSFKELKRLNYCPKEHENAEFYLKKNTIFELQGPHINLWLPSC